MVLLACISAFVLVVMLSFAGNHKQDRLLREIYKPVDVQAIDEDVLKVNTSIYVNRIHDVNRASGTFSANGWLWMSWDKPSDDDWREGEISIDTIKFINEIPNASKRDKLIKEPQEQYADLLSRFHFAKLDGFNHQAGCAKAPRAVSVRAVTERELVAKTRGMTRVSTNKGFIAIPIRTVRKPRSEAHLALNPINSAKGLRPQLNSAIEEKSEQCGELLLTYRISSTSYR